MKKVSPFSHLLLLYAAFLLVFPLFTILANPEISYVEGFGFATLTRVIGDPVPSQDPSSFRLMATISSGLSGILLSTISLFFCWRMFGNTRQQAFSILRSFQLSMVVVGLVLTIFTIFFTYGLSADPLASFSNKLSNAIWLSTQSFFSNGFSGIDMLIDRDFLENSFIVQLGMISCSTLGALGVYVILELFSPLQLRQRLANPSIDWSQITKVAVFGTIAITGLGGIWYWFNMEQALPDDKGIIDHLAYAMLDYSAMRGSGFSLSDYDSISKSVVGQAIMIFGGGPFSTLGGLSILGFVGISGLFFSKERHLLQLSLAITKYWVIILFVAFLLFIPLQIINNQSLSMHSFLALFTCNLIDTNVYQGALSSLLLMIINGLGRISFLLSCWLSFRKKSSSELNSNR